MFREKAVSLQDLLGGIVIVNRVLSTHRCRQQPLRQGRCTTSFHSKLCHLRLSHSVCYPALHSGSSDLRRESSSVFSKQATTGISDYNAG
jgi:hypothetical protein